MSSMPVRADAVPTPELRDVAKCFLRSYDLRRSSPRDHLD